MTVVDDEAHGKQHAPFSTPKFPAVSNALDASRGRCVRTTDAAIVSGASALSSSSGILSSGDFDILRRSGDPRRGEWMSST